MSLKLIFNNETKKLSGQKNYEDLVQYVNRAFNSLPKPFKFFYKDADGDIISVTSDDDLDEFRSTMSSDGLKLYIFGSQKEANDILNQNFSMINETMKLG